MNYYIMENVMRMHGINPLLEILGEPQSHVQICKTCGVCKPVGEFNPESASKRSNPYQRRLQCIDCWAELKGKMKRPGKVGATLFYYEAI